MGCSRAVVDSDGVAAGLGLRVPDEKAALATLIDEFLLRRLTVCQPQIPAVAKDTDCYSHKCSVTYKSRGVCVSSKYLSCEFQSGRRD